MNMIPPAPATLEELLLRLTSDAGLSAGRRRDAASSVRRFAEITGCGLMVRADFPTLRGILRQLSGPPAGMSKGRWANIQCDLRFVLSRYRAATRAPLPRDLPMEWQDLRRKLDTLRLRRGLSRFIHWCGRTGIEPEMVDDAVFAAFHRHLQTETLERRFDKNYRDSAKLWNDAVRSISGWPERPVTLPVFRKVVCLPIRSFPAGFGEDLARYGEHAGGLDLLAEDTDRQPLRRSTVNWRQHQLRKLASVMVREGRPIQEITSVNALYQNNWIARALQSELIRMTEATMIAQPRQETDERINSFPSLQELAEAVRAIGRHYVKLQDHELEQLRKIKARLRCRHRGITAKNRDRLRQFQDERNIARLFGFADLLAATARKRPRKDRKGARLMRLAVLHEILLFAPMRMQNLTRLQISRHLRLPPDGKGPAYIAIPGHEVKNGQDLEFELPLPTTRLLLNYLKTWRPLLVEGDELHFLFPGRIHGHLHQVTIGQHLAKTLMRCTGLAMNPHLYRHLAGYLFLQEHPGEYETLRQLLGHSSLETTMTFYANAEKHFASRRYAEHVLDRRLTLSDQKAMRQLAKGRSRSEQWH